MANCDIVNEFKNRWKFGSACCYPLQYVLFLCLHFENLKIQADGTMILSAILCGYGTWSLDLKEEQIEDVSEQCWVKYKRVELTKQWQ